MKHRLLILSLAAFTSLTPVSLQAQENENAAVSERMDRLEHDIMLLQKQVSQSPMPAGQGNGVAINANMPIDNPAQLEVRLSAMEDELRSLRGRIEQNEFQVKKLSDNFDKLQKDVDFRFSELQPKTPSATPVATPPDAAALKIPPVEPDTSGQTTAGDGTLHPPAEDPNSFATPRDLYNYAFRLLNETKYENAATAFDAFTKKYPKDPLVGNAYYWEGETFYIRRDYVSAADNFRQGFEALPDGPKAADNLLKLAMSLDALNRDKEACVVLGQITTKFKKSSTSITDKATSEQKRIGCQ